MKSVILYTDGGAIDNPGPGGYGVVKIEGNNRQELNGAFKETTNNRMEILAAIVGLESIPEPSEVTLYSDSKYLVQAINEQWAERWQANHWKRNKSEKAKNIDLWKRLLPLCKKHQVKFKWVKGHSGNKENERADRLVHEALRKGILPVDKGYEKENGSENQQVTMF
ncbi:MAG: ribonuclease HI [Anaerolineales bacterium]|nr:ribonuclease HI [Anaerolineales bacterium]